MKNCGMIIGSETQNKINGTTTAGFLFLPVNNQRFGVCAPTLFGRAAVLRLTNQNGPASPDGVGALSFKIAIAAGVASTHGNLTTASLRRRSTMATQDFNDHSPYGQIPLTQNQIIHLASASPALATLFLLHAARDRQAVLPCVEQDAVAEIEQVAAKAWKEWEE